MTPEEIEALEKSLKERGFETVEDLMADRDSIAEERDTFKERHTNAEKLVQRQGAELGQLRKTAGVQPPASGEPQAGDGAPPPEKKTVEQELSEVQASLTPEQKAAADAAYKNADDELKLKIANDPAAKLALMRHAQGEVKSIPETLFGSPNQETSEGAGGNPILGEEQIRELFQKERKAGSYYPGGSGGGSTTGGSGGEQPRQSKRPVGSGGVLSRIERDRAEVR